MSRSTRDEYLKTMRCRYRRYTGKPAKTKLLDEFCQVTGHERKYASKLLSSWRGHVPDGTTPPNRGGRPKTYDAEVVGVLFEIWRHSEQPCGKRLVPMLGDWLPFYEKHRGELKVATREAILKISPAQVDRVLASKKISRGAVNRRTPKTNAAVKALVPIRAQCWDANEPGWLEADTVAHCGGDMGGSFLWTLTATDIYSGEFTRFPFPIPSPFPNRFEKNLRRRIGDAVVPESVDPDECLFQGRNQSFASGRR